MRRLTFARLVLAAVAVLLVSSDSFAGPLLNRIKERRDHRHGTVADVAVTATATVVVPKTAIGAMAVPFGVATGGCASGSCAAGAAPAGRTRLFGRFR